MADSLFYLPMGRAVQRGRGIGLQAQAVAVGVGISGFFALLAVVRPGQPGTRRAGPPVDGVTWAAIAVSGTTVTAILAPKGLEG